MLALSVFLIYAAASVQFRKVDSLIFYDIIWKMLKTPLKTIRTGSKLTTKIVLLTSNNLSINKSKIKMLD